MSKARPRQSPGAGGGPSLQIEHGADDVFDALPLSIVARRMSDGSALAEGELARQKAEIDHGRFVEHLRKTRQRIDIVTGANGAAPPFLLRIPRLPACDVLRMSHETERLLFRENAAGTEVIRRNLSALPRKERGVRQTLIYDMQPCAVFVFHALGENVHHAPGDDLQSERFDFTDVEQTRRKRHGIASLPSGVRTTTERKRTPTRTCCQTKK